MMGYLHNILIPYVNATRDSLKLSKTHPGVVIFDTFKGQTTAKFFGRSGRKQYFSSGNPSKLHQQTAAA